MPAAIAIPAILGATGVGASIYGAHKAAGAAKDAASQQQQAAQQAQAFNQQIWQAQQKALQPYQQAGQQALGNLMQQYGSQTPQDFAARSAGFVNAARMNPYGQPFAPQQPQNQPTMSMAQLGGGTGGGFVTMRAPTGEITQVPNNQVQRLQALGAEVVR